MSKKKSRIEEHHRLPQAQGGKDSADNISFVQSSKHEAWHHLFPGDMPLETIVKELNKKWIPSNKKLVIEDLPPKDKNQIQIPYPR